MGQTWEKITWPSFSKKNNYKKEVIILMGTITIILYYTKLCGEVVTQV